MTDAQKIEAVTALCDSLGISLSIAAVELLRREGWSVYVDGKSAAVTRTQSVGGHAVCQVQPGKSPPVPIATTWGPIQIGGPWWYAVCNGKLIWWQWVDANKQLGRWRAIGYTIQDSAWQMAYAEAMAGDGTESDVQRG